MQDDIDRISESGFDAYLIKPFHMEDLFVKMAELFDASDEEARFENLAVTDKDILADEKYFKSMKAAILLIEEKYMPLWQKALDSKEFGAIRLFSERIHECGQEFNIRLLIDYGDKLILHCDNYDIENIDGSLWAFPAYLKKMRKVVETKNNYG
jgi:hypothetical protein